MVTRRALLSGAIAPALMIFGGRAAAFTVGLGTYEDNDPVVTYSGGWAEWGDPANSGGTAHYGNQVGATIALSFNGPMLSIVFVKQWNGGMVSVAIDGVIVDNVDTYWPIRLQQQKKTYRTGDGIHTVLLTITGGKNVESTDTYLVFDAFLVSSSGRRIQTVFDLMGPEPRAAEALSGWPGQTYAWAGSALSASTRMLRFDMGLALVSYAQWTVVWNPIHPQAGIRLAHADPGPLNVAEIHRLEGYGQQSPINTTVDVTGQINALIAAGVPKSLSHQQKGNGVSGPLIYQSALELVYEL